MSDAANPGAPFVFATVGNAVQGFPRLVAAIERFTAADAFGLPVVLQCGNTAARGGARCRVVPFCSLTAFAAYVATAEVVVCHAGAGTLLHVLSTGRVPVVVPRRRMYAEAVDDHQLELTDALAERGTIIVAYEADELPAAVRHALTRRPTSPTAGNPSLAAAVRAALLALGDN